MGFFMGRSFNATAVFLVALAFSSCAGGQTASIDSNVLPNAPSAQTQEIVFYAELVKPSALLALQSQSSPQNTQQSQTPNAQTQQPKSEREIAEEQLRLEEKQRLVGVIPQFNISYRFDAAPLSPGQKIRLALRSLFDPEAMGVAFLSGGLNELHDSTGLEWGAKGYFERVGAGYLDNFNGTMIGNAFLPILFKQDPRFFRLGHGSKFHRMFYAASTSFICRSDATRRWEPNYSNVLGNIAAGEISNFYYPKGNPNKIGFALGNGLLQTIEGSAGSLFQEFWPDISRKLLHKDPTHGMDAENEVDFQNQKAKRVRN